MEPSLIEERGSEIVQLSFAIPILILVFGLTAQVCIWASYNVQFFNAAEYVISHVDLSQLDGSGEIAAEALIANEIAGRMVGVNPDDITVSDVSVESNTAQTSTSSSSTSSTGKNAFVLFEDTGHCILKFRASCKAPLLISNRENLVINGNWQSDRVLYKTSEVRYETD